VVNPLVETKVALIEVGKEMEEEATLPVVAVVVDLPLSLSVI
jgi:hypothetical protein